MPEGWQPDGSRNQFRFGPKQQTERSTRTSSWSCPGAKVTGSTKLPWATAATPGLVENKPPVGLGNTSTPKTVNVWTVEHVGVPKGALKPSMRTRMNDWMQGSPDKAPTKP